MQLRSRAAMVGAGLLALALSVACDPLDADTLDYDGDGVPDVNDRFPVDPLEHADADGDGVGDNADAFPSDPDEMQDTDGDGVGDNADAFPADPAETQDTDGDGVGDNADAFPSDPEETLDTDGDGVGDNADPTPNGEPPTPGLDPFGGEPGSPISGLSLGELLIFATGLEVFSRTYTIESGLGPGAVADWCGACHNTPSVAGAGENANFRFRAVPPAGDDVVTERNPAALYGVAFFERVPDDIILSLEDPDDLNSDGISGRANYEQDQLGRFGSKAQSATLESIARGMLGNQLGITSEPTAPAVGLAPARTVAPGWLERIGAAFAALSFATPAYAQITPPDQGGDATQDGDAAADPELGAVDVAAMLQYLRYLATPLRGDTGEPALAGQVVFASIGCDACHVPSLAMSDGQSIQPYTDLLLHDMGDELADGIARGLADGREFRTAPLWGLTHTGPYLHDGRATTIQAAVEAHAGEAAAASDAYQALTEADREALISFLNSL